MSTKKGNQKLLPLKRRLRSNPTPAEQLLWSKLRGKQLQGMKFRRQHGIGSYIVDFYCPDRALVIEVDGDIHATDNQAKRDQIRDHYLQSLGLKIVRYTNAEIFKNLDGVLDHLSQGISNISTSPSLRSSLEQSLTKEGNFQDISNPLPRSFYDRPTLTVAQDLLGKVLVCQSTHRVVEAKIVEVEAYVGPQDKACHASKGRTNRTEVMFGPAGFTYVYLIYGMYHCLNLVTEQIDYPAAVLIRGLEITDGETTSVRVEGPGRVCRFLNVDRTHNELDATKGEILWVEDRGFSIPPKHIQALPRIGVDYAGEWAKKPWRFCIPLRPNPGKRTGKR